MNKFPQQLGLDFEAPPVLMATYPNRMGWLLAWARTSYPRTHHADPVIWATACGHRMVGIKGGWL
ncbi:MAG: hypothetical protein ACKVIS_22270 [Pseudomonadales bacterium]